MKWQEAEIIKIIDQTPDFKSFFMKPGLLYPYKSGNFVELALRQAQGKRGGAYKCYSAVSEPSQTDILEVGVKLYKNGELSPKLFGLKVGDKVLMRGPMGAGFIWEPSSRNTVMVAAGSGICPMVSILRQYNPKKGKLSLLFSTRRGAIYYENELQQLSEEKNVAYILRTSSEEGRVNKKFITQQFGRDINANTDFFVAGPTNFVQDTSFWLRELGINEQNLKTDDFTVSA